MHVRYQFVEQHRFVEQHGGQFCVAALCRVMQQVSRSGYYPWRRREPSKRQKRNETLLGRVRHFFGRGKGT